jgi:hypothetical protein
MESIVSKSSKKRPQNTKTKARARVSVGRPNPKTERRPTSGGSRPARASSKLIKRSKIVAMTAMLRRPKGASIADLCKATGWQAHSVRGAMSAVIKKKLGLKLTSEKIDDVRFYRVTG